MSLLHTTFTEYHRPAKNGPWYRLRYKQRYIVYLMEFNMEMCMYRQYYSSKYYKHQNENEEGWESEWDRYMSTCLEPGTVYILRFRISQQSQFLSMRNLEPRENDVKGI